MLQDGRWVQGINIPGGIIAQHIQQFVYPWEKISLVTLDPNTSDQITWKLTPEGNYTTKSVYALQFLGSTTTVYKKVIRKTWAPPKCKFFAWVAIQNRLWTSDRLQAWDWPNQRTCPLCRQSPETTLRLFFECRYARQVWTSMDEWLGCAPLNPFNWSDNLSIGDWWSSKPLGRSRRNKMP